MLGRIAAVGFLGVSGRGGLVGGRNRHSRGGHSGGGEPRPGPHPRRPHARRRRERGVAVAHTRRRARRGRLVRLGLLAAVAGLTPGPVAVAAPRAHPVVWVGAWPRAPLAMLGPPLPRVGVGGRKLVGAGPRDPSTAFTAALAAAQIGDGLGGAAREPRLAGLGAGLGARHLEVLGLVRPGLRGRAQLAGGVSRGLVGPLELVLLGLELGRELPRHRRRVVHRHTGRQEAQNHALVVGAAVRGASLNLVAQRVTD
mmetsp:Transcript_10945/g.25649  ORF Transcript_10945/g.25649 Transcript_10945/m.25649 type:complete len:255 (-) Transcript_10945:194-958(-)